VGLTTSKEKLDGAVIAHVRKAAQQLKHISGK